MLMCNLSNSVQICSRNSSCRAMYCSIFSCPIDLTARSSAIRIFLTVLRASSSPSGVSTICLRERISGIVRSSRYPFCDRLDTDELIVYLGNIIRSVSSCCVKGSSAEIRK